MVRYEAAILTTSPIDDPTFFELLALRFTYQGYSYVKTGTEFEKFHKFLFTQNDMNLVLGFKDSASTLTYDQLEIAS